MQDSVVQGLQVLINRAGLNSTTIPDTSWPWVSTDTELLTSNKLHFTGRSDDNTTGEELRIIAPPQIGAPPGAAPAQETLGFKPGELGQTKTVIGTLLGREGTKLRG